MDATHLAEFHQVCVRVRVCARVCACAGILAKLWGLLQSSCLLAVMVHVWVPQHRHHLAVCVASLVYRAAGGVLRRGHRLDTWPPDLAAGDVLPQDRHHELALQARLQPVHRAVHGGELGGRVARVGVSLLTDW